MGYITLKAGAGYLGRYKDTALDDRRRMSSELEADLWVDERWQDWDRSLWSGENIPPQVREAADMRASATYILKSMMAANPDTEIPETVRLLSERADGIANQCTNQGWVLGPDRQPQYSRKGRHASSRNVRLTR